jgi:hypothetical protein
MIIFFNYLCQSIYVHMVDLGWLFNDAQAHTVWCTWRCTQGVRVTEGVSQRYSGASWRLSIWAS